jgi:hypothetical protein
MYTSAFDMGGSARRVVYSYRAMTGQHPVIRLDGDKIRGQGYSMLMSTVEKMNAFGLHVVIDGGHPFASSVLEIGQMDRDEIRQIPQFTKLFGYINKYGLSDVTWIVLGGVPIPYVRLCQLLEERPDDQEVKSDIERFLSSTILQSIRSLYEARSNPHVREMIECVADSPDLSVRVSELGDQTKREVRLLDQYAVIHPVQRHGEMVLIPSCNAIALVLRHNLT